MTNGWFTADDKLIEKLRKILEEVTGRALKIGVELGGTDGRYLIQRMPVIQFGTIRGDTNFHGKNEFVYVEDIKVLKNFVKKIITTRMDTLGE